MNKSKVLDALHDETPVELIFEKADGSLRVMKASLHQDNLPEPEPLDPEKPAKVPNPALQAVYDLEAQGFRSFKWERLISVNGKLYEGVEIVRSET